MSPDAAGTVMWSPERLRPSRRAKQDEGAVHGWSAEELGREEQDCGWAAAELRPMGFSGRATGC